MSSSDTELVGSEGPGVHGPGTSESDAARAPRRHRQVAETRLARPILWLVAAVEFSVAFAAADRSYFWYDDVKWQVARAHGFPGYGFITQPVNDHFVPGWLFTQGIVPYLFGSHYWAQAALLALCVTAFSGLCWLLGKELGVSEPLLLLLVALLTLGGMTREAVSWWSSALHTLPPAVAVLGVLLAFLRFRRRRAWSTAVLGGLLLFVACSFIELSLIWVLLLPLFDLLVLGEGRPLSARLRGLWLHARFYGALALAGVLYLAWWLVSTPWPQQSHLGLGAFARYAWNSWFYGFWPMVTDVRGANYSPLTASSALRLTSLIAVQVALMAFVVWALWKRPRARGAFAWFVMAFLVNQYALSTGREQSLFGGAVASRYQFPVLIAFIVVLFVITGSSTLEPRSSSTVERPRALSRVGVVAVAGSVLAGALLFFVPVPSVPVLTRIAASQRVGFSSLAALPRGTTVLNVQAPWDAVAVRYNTPSAWMSIVSTKPGVHTTLVGDSPMVAPLRDGRFVAVTGPTLKTTPPVCGVTGSVLPLAEDIHLTFDRQVADAIVVRLRSLAPATLLAQIQMIRKGGRLEPWTSASNTPQVATIAPGHTIVWFPIAARVHGNLHAARVVIVKGGPVCMAAVGTGPVSSGAATSAP